jgi:hypothetical protein
MSTQPIGAATPFTGSGTPFPPSNTPFPPSGTPFPPSNTPFPPSGTPFPPSDTPFPAASAPAGLNPALAPAPVAAAAGDPVSNNPGFAFERDAAGVGYLTYDPTGNSFASPIRIEGRTATFPSSGYGQPDRVVTLRDTDSFGRPVPSWEQQIQTSQNYVTQARLTGQIVEVGPVLYHPNGNIQYYNVSNNPGGGDWYDYMQYTQLITSGLADPEYAGASIG